MNILFIGDVLGLAKKVLLANTLGELCEIFAESGEKSFALFAEKQSE